MSLVCLEPSELDRRRRGAEDSIGANSVVDVFLGYGIALVGFSFGEDSSL